MKESFCLTTNGEEMKFGQGPAVCRSLVSLCAVVWCSVLLCLSRLFASLVFCAPLAESSVRESSVLCSFVRVVCSRVLNEG